MWYGEISTLAESTTYESDTIWLSCLTREQHRTNTELLKKRKVGVQVVGG